ncbi:hypothetical protein C1646_758498 [Rhizophagus diaphanus]|nr:hypothetical protein C1646_758498 [Rhizophagus diaphanus] [Rhizophagus sp. MUCL 43196]
MNIQTLFDTLDVHIEGSADDTIRKQYQVTKNQLFLKITIYALSSSCTMKLYGIEDNLNNVTRKTIQNLIKILDVIAGFDDISLRYFEAQGKYTGLCIIEAYHKSRKRILQLLVTYLQIFGGQAYADTIGLCIPAGIGVI